MIHTSLLPPLPPIAPQNVMNFLLHRPEQSQNPDYPLLIDALSGKTLSFRQYRDRVSLGATALTSINLSPEGHDMVGIFSENFFDYFTLVHSLLSITTPFALLPSQSTVYELVYLLKLSKVTKVFVQPKYLDRVREAAKEIGLPDECILILEGHSPRRKSFGDLISDVQKRNVPRVPLRYAGPNTLAYIVFSSGTTGLPKGVMISHMNILTVSHQQSVTFRLTMPPKQEVVPITLALVPLYHSYGFQFFFVRSFLIRNTILLLQKWDREAIFTLVPKYRVTVLVLIPSLYHQLVNHPKFETTDWSSVVRAVSGSAHLPQDIDRRLCKRVPVKSIRQGYGLSECTLGAITHFEGAMGITTPPSSIGILAPGMEARVVREDGTDAEINEIGELWVRGGNIAMGYSNNPEATEKAFLPDGWLKTGDMFRIDENSAYFFEDRAKDTMKVSGTQVSPMEIEEVLRNHPDKLVLDVAVAGVSGGRTSDEKIPRAWVVLSQTGKQRGQAAAIEALIAWTQKSLTKQKWLRGGIEIVSEIPKSPTGKVLRRLLQDKYELAVKAKL